MSEVLDNTNLNSDIAGMIGDFIADEYACENCVVNEYCSDCVHELFRDGRYNRFYSEVALFMGF